jgi:hypothetical protein
MFVCCVLECDELRIGAFVPVEGVPVIHVVLAERIVQVCAFCKVSLQSGISLDLT